MSSKYQPHFGAHVKHGVHGSASPQLHEFYTAITIDCNEVILVYQGEDSGPISVVFRYLYSVLYQTPLSIFYWSGDTDLLWVRAGTIDE